MQAIDDGRTAQETAMIPAARRAKALELERRHGAISIQRLADEMRTSISTARRDVDYLSSEGYLERSHGGALLSVRSRTTFEPATDIADQVARAAKIAIGRCAAAMIEDEQSVILDSSSTVLEAAHALAERELSLTVVTNDLRIALALREKPNVQLIVPGGQVRVGSFTLIGSSAQSVIRSLHANQCNIGVQRPDHALSRRADQRKRPDPDLAPWNDQLHFRLLAQGEGDSQIVGDDGQREFTLCQSVSGFEHG